MTGYDRQVLKSYIANGWWLCGVLLDIGGALMTMISLSLAPVSVVQPVLGCGLAFVAIFSVSIPPALFCIGARMSFLSCLSTSFH